MARDEIGALGSELEKHRLSEVEFLNALCRAFQDKAMEYYSGARSDDDRLQRLHRIGESLKRIVCEATDTAGKRTLFTIAAEEKQNTAAATALDYICPPGMVCIDGNCIPVVRGVSEVIT